MKLLYALELFDEATNTWGVFEHPDETMRECSPVIAYNTLDRAKESLCMALMAKKGDGSIDPLVTGRLRINFYRAVTRQDHGYHTANLDEWIRFGEVSVEKQRTWAKDHYAWIESIRRESEDGLS